MKCCLTYIGDSLSFSIERSVCFPTPPILRRATRSRKTIYGTSAKIVAVIQQFQREDSGMHGDLVNRVQSDGLGSGYVYGFAGCHCRVERWVGVGKATDTFEGKRQTATTLVKNIHFKERLTNMSATMKDDWTKTAAMAIPEGGFDPNHVEKGHCAQFFRRRPLAMDSRSLRTLKPAVYEHAKKIKKAVGRDAGLPRLCWANLLVLAIIQNQSPSSFQYQGIFDTDFDKYTEDAVAFSLPPASIRSSKISKVSPRIGRLIHLRS